MTSAPGNTPQVTALGPSAALVRRSPCLLTYKSRKFQREEHVLEEAATHGVVGSPGVRLDDLQELLEVFRRSEELEVRL